MTVTSIVSVTDGPQITVSEIAGNPLWVPTMLKKLLVNQFISEALLRNAGSNPTGVVAYREGDPMFLEGDVQDVAEGGEIPVSNTGVGSPRSAFATKKALGIRITKEMIDENQIDNVNKQMTGLQNTFIRANDRVAKALLLSGAVPSIAVTTAWDAASGSKPRTDISKGIDAVSSAQPTVGQGGTDDEYFGFEPDTIVVHPSMRSTMLDNDQINKVYIGGLADQSILYTGALPETIFGLRVVQSRSFPKDKALICQRGVMGFYSDTRPLQFTGLYAEGGGPNGGPTETWRSDASQKRAQGLDQPKAAVWLTGLTTP
jgi:hypothetical protein